MFFRRDADFAFKLIRFGRMFVPGAACGFAPKRDGITTMEMLSTFDVPDVFATTTKIESAGGGCIRIYNCIVKNGTLIPVGNAVVFPASCILSLAESAQDFAKKVTLLDMGAAQAH